MKTKSDTLNQSCREHSWITLDQDGLCSFCVTQAIEKSEFETCSECGHKRKAYDPIWNDVDDDDYCDECLAYNSFA